MNETTTELSVQADLCEDLGLCTQAFRAGLAVLCSGGFVSDGERPTRLGQSHGYGGDGYLGRSRGDGLHAATRDDEAGRYGNGEGNGNQGGQGRGDGDDGYADGGGEGCGDGYDGDGEGSGPSP